LGEGLLIFPSPLGRGARGEGDFVKNVISKIGTIE